LKKAFSYQLSAQKARIGEPENRGIGEEKIISPVLPASVSPFSFLSSRSLIADR